MTKKDKALELFYGNFNCSQSVFSIFAADFGITNELALKLASGFGAGIARQQKTCGAVSAAVMLIGLKHGNYKSDDCDSKENTYRQIQDFNKKFLQKFPSLECSKLVNCDFSTEEGQRFFGENKIQEKVCSVCITYTIEILDEMLKDN